MAVALLPSPRKRVTLGVTEILLASRALLFAGRRYTCPCCGWRLRAFTAGGTSLRRRHLSYCPRCNSKARHRRIWLFLQERTNLFDGELRLFEVSPKFSFARRFVRMRGLDYLGADLVARPHVGLRMDLTSTPIRSETFDALICVHVLEEIADDASAISELYRILRPGGWALVSVPTDMERPTYEDPTITDPKERKRVFGEKAHVRIYGYDLVDRLEAAGFEVEVDLAKDLDRSVRDRYGLRDDENIFFCRRAA